MEAGRRSPMGEGVYRFQTIKGDDSEMYELFKRYVTEVEYGGCMVLVLLRTYPLMTVLYPRPYNLRGQQKVATS